MVRVSFTHVLLLLGLCVMANSQVQLEKVLILSRHNLRTPLTASLSRLTPKKWPEWTEKHAQLTKKGALLESYLGDYFSQWLKREKLFKDCPKENEIHIYANTRQRTKATADAFAKSAFRDCSVTVYSKNSTKMDPIFNPIVRNSSKAYIDAVKKEMSEKINTNGLDGVYNDLNKITDINNSLICKEDSYCDLANDKDKIIFEIGKEPNVDGPLFIGCSMVDAFLMSYYEGMPMEQIAWGQIKTDDQWKVLTKILQKNLNVRFNLTVANDLTAPLLKYMKEKLLNNQLKFVILTGHDSNIFSVIRALNFKPFDLPEQFELSPIGGKVVFQKWRRGENYFLKIDYVYQSSNQIRNGEKLSLENPPKIVPLTLENCVPDADGFCSWNDFVNILKNIK